MNKNISRLIRINKIYIKNYKAIDELEIEFTKPLMRDDLDVFVLGSGNGVGKTSVLECCSLFFLFLTFEKAFFVDPSIWKYL
ncbi:MAG: ATP-binding protein, partial [Candidatus Pacearchaeota archaeon]|nr:ATP-binding protein [Candidatus Pacearchaeota archaeon]